MLTNQQIPIQGGWLKCRRCGDAYTLDSQSTKHFCSPICKSEFEQDLRRSEVTSWKENPRTYFSCQLADDELQAQRGRFGYQRPTVVGTEPTVRIPGPVPAWLEGPQPGDEPPLGFSVDELPALGGAGEPVVEEPPMLDEPEVEPEPALVPTPRFRRRI
jgi:hypothetical protein